MLQRNASPAHRAHLAHAALIGLHSLCCGLPALAMAAAALSGAASGIALFADIFESIHVLLHGYELWILGLSAALVVIGGALELRGRRVGHAHGFPWLFAFSAFCFLVNAGIIFLHQ